MKINEVNKLANYIFNKLKRDNIGDSNITYPLVKICDITICWLEKFENNYYVIYLLQNRILINNNKRVHVDEILIADFDNSDFISLVDNELSIYDFFNKETTSLFKVGKLNNKQFPSKFVTDINVINDKIPDETVYLSLSDDYKLSLKELFLHK